MRFRPFTRSCIGLALLTLAAGCSRPLTPEASRARGDAMLKQMSQTLAGSQAFSYKSDQAIDRMKGGGEKVTEHFSRSTVIRRPNSFTFTDSGQDHSGSGWYDGKYLTIVSDRDKIWVR